MPDINWLLTFCKIYSKFESQRETSIPTIILLFLPLLLISKLSISSVLLGLITLFQGDTR